MHMAKRRITPLGKHKPLRSSWGAIPMQPNRDATEPYCFRSGQYPAMQEQWAKAQKQKSVEAGLAILKRLM